MNINLLIKQLQELPEIVKELPLLHPAVTTENSLENENTDVEMYAVFPDIATEIKETTVLDENKNEIKAVVFPVLTQSNLEECSAAPYQMGISESEFFNLLKHGKGYSDGSFTISHVNPMILENF